MMIRTMVVALGLLCAADAQAGFTVSSQKKASGGMDAYGAASALDGRPETAWMVDPGEQNTGSWIEIDVPRGAVDKVSLIVGWAKGDEAWQDHSRVKSATIQVFDLGSGDPKMVHEQKVAFEDVRTPQVVDLPDPKVGGDFEGGRVRVTIQDVFAGKDYDQVALSEFLVHMGEFDVHSVTLDASGAPDGSERLVDGNKSTFWKATAGDEASFMIDPGRYSVSSLRLVPGPRSYARPKVVEVIQADTKKTYNVSESSSGEWLLLPALVGYTGSGVGPVTVRIAESWGDTPVAISEVQLRATMLEAF